MRRLFRYRRVLCVGATAALLCTGNSTTRLDLPAGLLHANPAFRGWRCPVAALARSDSPLEALDHKMPLYRVISLKANGFQLDVWHGSSTEARGSIESYKPGRLAGACKIAAISSSDLALSQAWSRAEGTAASKDCLPLPRIAHTIEASCGCLPCFGGEVRLGCACKQQEAWSTGYSLASNTKDPHRRACRAFSQLAYAVTSKAQFPFLCQRFPLLHYTSLPSHHLSCTGIHCTLSELAFPS